MTNEQAIIEIDKGIILLQGIRAGLLAQAAPVVEPSPVPAPVPAPAPTPAPTGPLTATLLGREGDYANGAKAAADGQLDVHIRLTGLPADVVAVTVRDGVGGGAVWTHNANNTWIVVIRPAPGGVADLYFPFWEDYPKYTVDAVLANGTAVSLVAAAPASGSAPAPEPTPPPPPTFPAQPAGNRTGRIPYTDQYCSAVMDGLVVCNIVMLESDSATHTGTRWDEEWTQAEKEAIHNQSLIAFSWWKEAFARAIPNAKHPLRIHTRDYRTLYEPVTVSYEPITMNFSDRAKWVRQAMNKLGYSGSDELASLRKFNHKSRVHANADWAFTMFVVDSSNDVDGKFADGYACWSYFGGPACFLTSDGGAWGTDRLWRCMVHEWAHVFGPRDSYAGSGSKYTDLMGLHKVQNTNAVDGRPAGAPPQVPDIMAGASMQDASLAAFAPCRETRWALGWIDSDGDGILDARGK